MRLFNKFFEVSNHFNLSRQNFILNKVVKDQVFSVKIVNLLNFLPITKGLIRDPNFLSSINDQVRVVSVDASFGHLIKHNINSNNSFMGIDRQNFDQAIVNQSIGVQQESSTSMLSIVNLDKDSLNVLVEHYSVHFDIEGIRGES